MKNKKLPAMCALNESLELKMNRICQLYLLVELFLELNKKSESGKVLSDFEVREMNRIRKVIEQAI